MKLITVDAQKYRDRGDEFYIELARQMRSDMTDRQFADLLNATADEHGLPRQDKASYASMFRTQRYRINDNAKKVLLLAADDIELPPTGHEIVDVMVDPNAAWYSMLPNGDRAAFVFLSDRMLLEPDPIDTPELGENSGYTCNTGKKRGHEGEVKRWIREFYALEFRRHCEDLGLTWNEFWAETDEMWRRRRMEQTNVSELRD